MPTVLPRDYRINCNDIIFMVKKLYLYLFVNDEGGIVEGEEEAEEGEEARLFNKISLSVR